MTETSWTSSRAGSNRALPAVIPFTLLMLTIMACVAVATQTHVGSITANDLQRHGFSPSLLPALEWHRLVTSAFVTSGGTTFYGSFSMLAVCVGAAEVLYGTRRVLVMFWASHLLTLIALSLCSSRSLCIISITGGAHYWQPSRMSAPQQGTTAPWDRSRRSNQEGEEPGSSAV